MRFPHSEAPNDTGWHLDVSFAAEDSAPDDYFSWRVNLRSRGRALLQLFLFSDVGEDDAPTHIALGSHRAMAGLLQRYGDAGISLRELAGLGLDAIAARHEQALATGAAGGVWLCHPLLLHAAQAHRGTRPRVMSQPELPPATDFDVEQGTSPVERAIRLGLADARASVTLHPPTA